MKNNLADTDLEYLRKFVIFGSEKYQPIQKAKRKAALALLIVPVGGMLISITSYLDYPALRIVFIAIMAGGIVCAIASDKWFSGNRGYLFLAWLVATGNGVTSLIIGIVLAFNTLIVLIIIFIVIHGVLAIWTLYDILERVSSRQITNEKSMRVRKFYDVCIYLLLGGYFVSNAIKGTNYSIVIAAAGLMFGGVLLWTGLESLFKLYYAVTYKIDVVNTWDPQGDDYVLSEKYQCPLLNRLIGGNLCMKINYGNAGMIKQDELKKVKKELHMTSEEIKQICAKCSHSK